MRIFDLYPPGNNCFRPFIVLIFFLSGYADGNCQPTVDDRLIIQHYSAAERFPYNIADITFDDQGLLWICPENDNIRVFDGRHLRILETSVAEGTPHWEYSKILKDSAGRLYFFSEFQKYLYRLDSTGQLSQNKRADSRPSAAPFNNGYAYFDWDRFIQNGGNEEGRTYRRVLRSQLSGNKTFFAYNDSTFICKIGDSLTIFNHGRHRRLPIAHAKYPNALFLNDGIYILGPQGFSRLEEPQDRLVPVALTGDILKDSRYDPLSLQLPVTVYTSVHPHIEFNHRLYRISFRDARHLETTLVIDLAAFSHRMSKVEYNPLQDITAIATWDDGVFLLRQNPFYPNLFDDRFQALKGKQIFYPLILRQTDTFFTGWSEFTCKGYYRVFDVNHIGPKVLYKDRTGFIWEGGKSTLRRYDPNLSKHAELTLPMPSTSVVDVCEDEGGRLYFLTDRSILEYQDGAFRDKNPTGIQRMAGISVQQLVYISGGTFWIPTIKGLYYYDSHSNTVRREENIPEVPIGSITKLTEGATIFTCYDETFYYYYLKGHFYRIPVEPGLPLNEISSVIEDKRGRIWFTTTSGLFVTTAEEIESFCRGDTKFIYYYKYGRDEGLQYLEFNGGLNPSTAISPDGYILFNSMGGIAIFHQDSVKEQFPFGAIGLTKKGKTVEEYTVGDSVVLSHDNDGMQLQVRIPYYGDRENLLIEYRFTPTSTSWQPVDEQGHIFFNHLDHGLYRLSIRARTGLRPGDFVLRTIIVKVPGLFYEEPAFRLLAGLIFLSICIAVTLHIVRLRREVRQKNIRLHDQNLELQQTMGELKDNISMKEKLISLILHDLKTPLYFQSLIFNKINDADYFTNAEARRLFHELKNSSAAILQFTKEFLTWYSSQREGFIVRPLLFNYRLVVDDLYSVYKDIAEKKSLTLGCNNDDIEELYTDRTILEIILRNLLDNAIKYTDAGQVTLSFQKHRNGTAIVVTDTGRGMTPERIQELHSYLYNAQTGSAPTFGYRFIYTLAEKIGAGIHISSEPGKGTSVTVIIPPITR
jgi:signal transduction histidine kinase/sugar lactone lactonase YvrE